MRLGAVLLAVIAIGAPAGAQTFDEAVQANFELGIRLCLGGGADYDAWAARFRAAGFEERVERSSLNSDTTHHFTAPADTVSAELYYGELPEHCTVSSTHMGVTAASAVLDRIVPAIYPSYTRHVSQSADGAICARYEDPTNPIGHVVGITPTGDGGGCAEDGTSRFYSSYRV